MFKKWLAIGLKTAVSGGLIWYLLSGIDMASMVGHLAEVDIGLLILSCFVLIIQVVIGGLRWNSVLFGLGSLLPNWISIRLFYIGAFFNQALPGGNGGDAARMYLSYKYGLTLRHALNGVIIERVATVLTLVVLVDVTQPLFLKHLDDEMARLSVTGIVTITVLALAGVGVVAFLDRLPEGMRRWRVVRGLGNLGVDTRQIMFNVSRLWKPICWSIIGHLNISLVVFILAAGLGLEASLLDCIVLIPPILLVLSIPISIGGWGVREGAIVWGFALVGVPNDAALALSLLFGVAGLVVSLPGGIVWLTTRAQQGDKIRPSDGLAVLSRGQENA